MYELPRTGPASFAVPTPNNVNITLFATPEVAIDKASVAEIVSFARIQDTVRELVPTGFFGDIDAGIERIILTPDFHRAAGIPVGTVFRSRGFVVPKAVGNDIGCGMRLLTADLSAAEIERLDERFEQRLRHIFFEGGRAVALSPSLRDGMLRHGLQALLEGEAPATPTWDMLDPRTALADLMRCHALGGFTATPGEMFAEYVAGSAATASDLTYDDSVGSIGGGNHFVELQTVVEIADGAAAHDWGLRRGGLTIMVHSGSVGLGHQVGTRFMDLARDIHPEGRRPKHGFAMLPTDGKHHGHARAYLDAMRAAANFAFANRFFLGLMTLRALSETLGRRVTARLVHDAPHNLIWSADEHTHLHRKGACPALGPDGDPEFPQGHPVIVPGSMGDASWVLRGLGNTASFCSACHGAGRLAPRGEARRYDPAALDRIRVVGKIDPNAAAFRQRPDILAEWRQGLGEEAPSAYKPVGPVIDTIARAEIASPVARLAPLLTIKG